MTREEAIQELEETNTILKSWGGFTEYPQALYIAIEMAIEALKDRPQGEWIQYSGYQPKENQEVYVTVYFTEGDTGRAYGYMDGFGKWHLYSAVEGVLNSGYKVTAWMPLPAPYKGRNE